MSLEPYASLRGSGSPTAPKAINWLTPVYVPVAALLWLASDEGLTTRQMSTLLTLKPDAVQKACQRLRQQRWIVQPSIGFEGPAGRVESYAATDALEVALPAQGPLCLAILGLSAGELVPLQWINPQLHGGLRGRVTIKKQIVNLEPEEVDLNWIADWRVRVRAHLVVLGQLSEHWLRRRVTAMSRPYLEELGKTGLVVVKGTGVQKSYASTSALRGQYHEDAALRLAVNALRLGLDRGLPPIQAVVKVLEGERRN